MPRRRRMVVLSLVGLLVSAAVTGAVLFVFVLPPYVRGRIDAALAQARITHASYRMTGIGLVGTEIRDVALGSPRWLAASRLKATYEPADLISGRLGGLLIEDARWRVVVTDDGIDWGVAGDAGEDGGDEPLDLPVDRVELRGGVIELVIDGVSREIPIEGTVTRRSVGALDAYIKTTVLGERLVIDALLDEGVQTRSVTMSVGTEARSGDMLKARIEMPRGSASARSSIQLLLRRSAQEVTIGERRLAVEDLNALGNLDFDESWRPLHVDGQVVVGRVALDEFQLQDLKLAAAEDETGVGRLTIAASSDQWRLDELRTELEPLLGMLHDQPAAPITAHWKGAIKPLATIPALAELGYDLSLPNEASIAGTLSVEPSAENPGAWLARMDDLSIAAQRLDLRLPGAMAHAHGLTIDAPIRVAVSGAGAEFKATLEQPAAIKVERLEAVTNDREQVVSPVRVAIDPSQSGPAAWFSLQDQEMEFQVSSKLRLAEPGDVQGEIFKASINELEAVVAAGSNKPIAVTGHLSLAGGEYPPLKVEHGLVEFQKAPDSDAQVTTLTLDAGPHGRFSARPFSFNAEEATYVNVLCEEVSLGPWLRLLSGDRVDGVGKLQGRLHLGLDLESRHRTFRFGLGVLHAQPEQGWFAIVDRDLAENTVANLIDQGAIDAAYQQVQQSIIAAFQGFDFQALRVDVEPQDGDVLCQVVTRGKGRRGDPPIEFASLTVNINQFERVFNQVLSVGAVYDRLRDQQ